MGPEELLAALRRARTVAALRALAGPATRERARRAWANVRRHPDVVVVLALGVGVVAMILHWR